MLPEIIYYVPCVEPAGKKKKNCLRSETDIKTVHLRNTNLFEEINSIPAKTMTVLSAKLPSIYSIHAYRKCQRELPLK